MRGHCDLTWWHRIFLIGEVKLRVWQEKNKAEGWWRHEAPRDTAESGCKAKTKNSYRSNSAIDQADSDEVYNTGIREIWSHGCHEMSLLLN